MKRQGLLAVLLLLTAFSLKAQLINSDNQFQRPLSEVLQDIEEQYHITLKFSMKDVKGKVLKYANWRFRPDVEETLKNVLGPFDMVANPESPGVYKVKEFQYHRRTVAEAREFLNYLTALYSSKEEWEVRREAIKSCLPGAVRLNEAPASPGTEPILTEARKMKGYTVQNLALEVIPGVYATGSIYKPAKLKGKVPVVLCPNGHFGNGRYNKDVQARCAGLARMGAVAVSYDLFGWGESGLQFDMKYHRKALANTMQVLNSTRLLDYLLGLDYIDGDRVAITGGSGGGSHSILMAALDDRIDVSVPTVMMSAIHYGGCPCESGNPIHLCEGGTNNVELAGIFAPKPQLIISDGGDWTSNVPELEFPFLKRIYSFYDAAGQVENKHLPDERHDYGPSKREAMYHFMAKYLQLDESKVFDKNGALDESSITIEEEDELKVYGANGERLPGNAIKSFEALEALFQ